MSPQNVESYFTIKSVVACGGTWMAPTNMVEGSNWDGIALLIKAL